MNRHSTPYLTTIVFSGLLFTSAQAGPPNPTISDGLRNTAGGSQALLANSGADSTAFGNRALAINTFGNNNTALGSFALGSNTTGIRNTAMGAYALFSNINGIYNTAIGQAALIKNTSGLGNTALGLQALYNSTGSYNLAIGFNSGLNLASGNFNIYLANLGVTSESSTMRLGSANQIRTFISGIRGVRTGLANAVAVVIDSNGQLGTVNSSERFKKDIKDMNTASHGLLQLRPVTYRYKEEAENSQNPLEYGLIAEEVAKVYPDLVAYGADGKIETVQYHKLTPMLLNELKQLNTAFQTEKAKTEAQAQTIQQQAKEIAYLKQKTSDIEDLKRRLANLQAQAKGLDSLSARLSRIEAERVTGKTALSRIARAHSG